MLKIDQGTQDYILVKFYIFRGTLTLDLPKIFDYKAADFVM